MSSMGPTQFVHRCSSALGAQQDAQSEGSRAKEKGCHKHCQPSTSTDTAINSMARVNGGHRPRRMLKHELP